MAARKIFCRPNFKKGFCFDVLLTLRSKVMFRHDILRALQLQKVDFRISSSKKRDSKQELYTCQRTV
jgi:hypothetical protein